jgi:periplasmic copper chaperone A
MKSLMLALALLVGLTGIAQAQSSSNGTIEIVSAWARATAAGSLTGGAFLTIVNKGSSEDRLVSVSTTAAGMAELHRTQYDNGIAKMLPVGAIEVKAGQKVALAPSGYHIMLMNLKASLKEGESFPLTLTFGSAGKIDVMVKIVKAGAMGPDDMGGMNMN